MEFFDSHCHLDPLRFGDEVPAVLSRASLAGVTRLLVVGTRALDSEAAVRLARDEKGVFAAVGIHPNDTGEVEVDEWDRIVHLASSGGASAIGESGLDWFRDSAPADCQREYFERHIRLAQEHRLPLVVHSRESIDDCLSMLRNALRTGPLTAVLHSFTGNAAQAAEAIDLGLFLGFAGMVTFRSSAALREVARSVPAERLLVETDSPFLSPEPLRGRRNEPANVVHTAQCLAIARGESLGDLAMSTTSNALHIFGRR